jgi:exopolyphosphatase/guanosine-5'-triphosphate,3'-diphosphate pyrophosphatase
VRVFRRTVTTWNQISRAGLWGDLERELVSGLKATYSGGVSMPSGEQKERIEEFVQSCTGAAVHSRLVARLSLELFDQLRTLHNLAGKERNLLEYAALLHDTGLKRSGKKRERESARMIQRAAELPLSLQERGTIGLLVSSHQGRDSWETRPYFGILPRDEQEIIRRLAGLLTVAEALDESHRGRVSSVACEVTPDGVTCTVQASSDCSREIAMARERAISFERAFGRTLHVGQAGEGVPPGEAREISGQSAEM